MWRLKKLFWDLFIVVKFRFAKPRHVPVPAADPRKIRPIPLVRRYPSIPVSNVLVADHVPVDENQRPRFILCKIQALFYRIFPPKAPGLPSIDSNPMEAVARAYGQGHRKSFPAPVVPEEYRGAIDLGHLAVAGPYSCYLQRAAEGGYEWDLRDLGDYECHPGLRSRGVRVLFAVDKVARRLVAVEIDCELGRYTPTDPEWELAQKIALCAATTHLSVVRHFNGVHLALAAQFAVATRNTLPTDHSVRRLLWPHLWGTQYSNELITELFMMKGGDLEEIFSFTHAGL